MGAEFFVVGVLDFTVVGAIAIVLIFLVVVATWVVLAFGVVDATVLIFFVVRAA